MKRLTFTLLCISLTLQSFAKTISLSFNVTQGIAAATLDNQSINANNVTIVINKNDQLQVQFKGDESYSLKLSEAGNNKQTFTGQLINITGSYDGSALNFEGFSVGNQFRLAWLSADGNYVGSCTLNLTNRAAPVAAASASQTAARTTPQTLTEQGEEEYQRGIAYYDALKLASNNLTKAQWLSILSYYLQVSPDVNSVTAALKKYPFLNVLSESSATKQDTGLHASLVSNFIGAAGGLDVTNFADGLAKFLIARSKEELNVAFFRRFQDFVNNYPEAVVAFPQTSSFISRIASYQYAAMLPALRTAFISDLNELSGDLLKLRDMDISACSSLTNTRSECESRITKIKEFFHTEEGRAIAGALLVADRTMKGDNAAEVLDALAGDPSCRKTDENFSSFVQLGNLISRSLRSKDDDRIWVTKDQIKKLVSNEAALKIYFGLLYAMDTNLNNGFRITFHNENGSESLSHMIDILASKSAIADANIALARQAIKDFGNAAADISDAYNKIKQSENADIQDRLLMYADYTRSLTGFFETGVQFYDQLQKIDVKLPPIKGHLNKFIGCVTAADNACYDIRAKNYSSFVMDVSIIIDSLVQNHDSKFYSGFMKYGIFMASVAEAKNSDEVSAAIETAVLPVGSSSIKRETNCNISLNAYIGATGGYEYMPANKQKQWSPVVGVTAPVGVAFSWGNIGNGKRKDGIVRKHESGKCKGNEVGGKSFTIFVPLIDVGAVATYRLGDTSTQVATKIELKDIISPGLYFYYGFGKCPVSFGIGGQLGPQLRDIKPGAVSDSYKNYYFRFGANLVVDIPFFNFYTKTGD